MADLSVTNTFVPGNLIIAGDMNTNFSDIVTFINNRNNGITSWGKVITSSDSTIGGDFSVIGNTGLSGTLQVTGIGNFIGGVVIDEAGDSELFINSGTATSSPVIFGQITGNTKLSFGVAGDTGSITAGTASGDTALKTAGGSILFSTDNGSTSKFKMDGSGVATFSGQLVGKGTSTKDNAASGYIGEYIEETLSTHAVPNDGVWGDVTNITLTAGDWDITLLAEVQAIATVVNSIFAISIHAGTDTTDHVAGINQSHGYNPTAAGGGFSAIPSYRVSINTDTTYYYKVNLSYGSGTPKLDGRISARRVR